uniref:Uncharacterized protein n=1 Tax=Pelusios castaneus TaxID=367368 RepID=A0A8C8SRR9_9SAUR
MSMDGTKEMLWAGVALCCLPSKLSQEWRGLRGKEKTPVGHGQPWEGNRLLSFPAPGKRPVC